MKRIGQWLEVAITPDLSNKTIYHVLSKEVGASKALIHKLNMSSAIKRNDQQADVNHKLKAGDRLFLQIFKDEDFGVIPQYQQLDVLYEDDHLLIINKRPGIDTHPNNEDQTGTLANGVAAYYQMNGIQTKVRHIHRLDKDTSGAIIFAKHSLAHSLLDQELEKRNVKRTYLAIVEGQLPKQKGTINQPIGKDRHHPTRRRISPNGQTAVTHYEVKRFIPKKNVSLLSIRLETGRTHQIRVHLSSIGYPIIGDDLYGGKRLLNMNRQALHAEKVSLFHPLTSEKIEVVAGLAPDMDSIV